MRILSHIRSIIPAAALAAAGICTASLQSCERYVLPELSFEPDTLTFTALGGTQPVELNCNVVWSANTSTVWLDTDILHGEGSCVVNITALPNESRARKATADFKTETIKRSLVVLQEGIDLDTED